MKGYRLAALAAFGVLAAGGAAAGEDKWGAHVDLEGKAGTKRNLGEADVFLPLAQNADSVLFADIRTRMDDEQSREGNFGLGLRHMLDSGWNLGGYGFFDRRRSEYHNYFNQVTFGAEALSPDWDVRANGYIPVGRRSHDEDSLNTAEISGSTVIFRGGEERSLGGFDAEIGWRVPVFAADAGQNLRVYAGGYRFADDGVPTVAGPRARAEMVFDEVPGLWDGSRLALGAEWQHDSPRGSQGFLSARLRIPLQAESFSTSRLTPMERRMADPIVRDVDIVAQAGTFGAAETATASNGNTLTVVSSATTTGANLQNALNAAGVNSTVILSGTFNTTSSVTLQSGQTVRGSGNITVSSPSGRTATLSQSSSGTINASLGVQSAAVNMASNSTLTGMTIAPTSSAVVSVYGVEANNVTGVTIDGNTISVANTNSAAIGLRFMNNASGTASGNTVTASRPTPGGGVALAVQVDNSTVKLNDNSFSASGSGSNDAIYLNHANIQSGSTGNLVLAGVCNVNTVGTGSAVSYTSGSVPSTCGP